MQWVINLPYSSLEPYISDNTLYTHYNDHHKKYAENLYNLLSESDRILSLEELMFKHKNTINIPIKNNMNQIFCHNFFWEGLNAQSNQLQLNIDESILKNKILSMTLDIIIAAMKLFGSGYIWICRQDNEIVIISMLNADIPQNMQLLLCIDIWEHAYYLDYKSKKSTFVENLLLNCIDWTIVYKRSI